uniref:Uncharacterized protein n=1 Tax=Plectus sambesii TaxID=2011161 RepID=A0A914X446_9BILA
MSFHTGHFLPAVTVGVIFSLLAYSADAVTCFDCSSGKEMCNSGQCEGEYCTKFKTVSNQYGGTIWARGCATSTVQSPITAGCQKTKDPNWSQDACYCKGTDYCNASPPTKETATEYIILLSAAVFAVFMSQSA